MKVPKAIETLSETPYLVTHEELQAFQTALKLSIEALKYVKRHSPYGYAHQRDLLPGETKD